MSFTIMPINLSKVIFFFVVNDALLPPTMRGATLRNLPIIPSRVIAMNSSTVAIVGIIC